jgi:hypothetical protein
LLEMSKYVLATQFSRSCLNSQIPCEVSHRTYKQVLVVVRFKLVERSKPFDIFCCSPPFFNQRRGEALSRGEREIRDELGSQPS